MKYKSIRISKEEYREVVKASELFDIPIARIAEKSIRKWERVKTADFLKSVVSENNMKHTTYNGAVINLPVAVFNRGYSTQEIRAVMMWHVRDQLSRYSEPCRLLDTCKTGYEILEIKED